MNNDLKKILRDLRKGKETPAGIHLNIGEEGALKLKGTDGYTPKKGVDYWTPEELNEMVEVIFKAAKPKYGVDYYTEADKRKFVADVLKMATPIKGVHYRDGVDGETPVKGIDYHDGISPDTHSVAIDAITVLESFEGDARLSAKALRDLDEAVTEILQKGGEMEFTEKQIKSIKDLLPQYPPMNAGGSGATFLKSLRDVDLSGLTKNADGKYVLGGGGGSSTFLTLTDTPSTYSGQAGKFAKVNATEDGVEFETIPGGGDMLAANNLSDVANVATARTNLGLGTAAQSASTDFAPALGVDDNYVTDAEKAALHPAVTVTDSAEIDLTLTGQDITASLKAASIDETKLDASVNASLDLADSAVQPAAIANFETTTQLNTRDTNNRSRANHTGTQLASTISDIQATIAANSAVAANTAKVTNATHTGDVTGDTALTIANSAVTLAKMANLAQDQFIGRTTASTGVPQTATITAAARTVLDDTSVANMVNTLGGATSTGTGGLVRSGSPALVTPSIAAITVSGGTLTLPTGASDTLVSKNSTDTLTNKTLTSPVVNTPTILAPKLTVVNLGSLGATETIDWNAGDIFYGILDSNVTITHSNEASGRTITEHWAYDGSAQRTITHSDVDRWTDNNDGSAPTTPSASGEVLTITKQYYGTTCVASATGNYAVYA